MIVRCTLTREYGERGQVVECPNCDERIGQLSRNGGFSINVMGTLIRPTTRINPTVIVVCVGCRKELELEFSLTDLVIQDQAIREATQPPDMQEVP